MSLMDNLERIGTGDYGLDEWIELTCREAARLLRGLAEIQCGECGESIVECGCWEDSDGE
jgi:hypothetical protein